MALAPLTRLGPYEVVSSAGAGGMGEVYRALDTRLGRHVAIKVLPASTASSPEWRQRLEREARAVSALSHPNICALYDIGHQDGIDFLVMEFLEGETLAARLERGPLPTDQAIKTGIEIADALQSAHRKGIVHRDLKPSNVMLTRTGARLLDFGLAKPVASAIAGRGIGETVSAPLTTDGMLLGTFQYMSPEQVEGREADARSDLFAFGAVLHEMLTGVRAFDGKTPASVIAAILEREPPSVSSLQPLTPPALDDIVRGCLAKDADERWQTAHDVKLQLQGLRTRAAPVATGAAARVTRRELIAWGTAAAALVAAAALGNMSRETSPAPAPVLRASLLPPAGHSFVPNDFAISPDGRRVAFVAAGVDGVPTLWVQVLDSSQAVEVTGTMGASSPFWSPDSRWIAFFTDRRLMKVEPGGTGIQTILDISPGPRNGAWGAQDVIVFTNNVLGPLLSVPAAGGAATPVTSVPANVTGEAHRFPRVLTRRQAVLVRRKLDQPAAWRCLPCQPRRRDAGARVVRDSRPHGARERPSAVHAGWNVDGPGVRFDERPIDRRAARDSAQRCRAGLAIRRSAADGVAERNARFPVAPRLQHAAGIVRPQRTRAGHRRFTGILGARACRRMGGGSPSPLTRPGPGSRTSGFTTCSGTSRPS